MRKYSRIVLAALAIIVCVSSCKRRHEPEQPAKEPTNITEFTDGGAYYFGQPNGYPDINMFCVYLLNGQTRVDDRVISGVGSALWLDMNVTKNAKNELAVGTYSPARNDYSPNSFLKGAWIDENTLSGSFVYYRDANGSAQYHMITNGSVQINISSGKVSIQAEVIADGVEYTFDFYDFFSYTDVVSQNPGGDPSEPASYVVNNFKYGMIESEGQVYDNPPTQDYWLWKVLLGDDQNWADGREIQWELVTSKSATDIVGTYTVKAADFNANTMASVITPGSAICGYTEENSNGGLDYWGSWFFPSNDDSTWLGATEGTVKVSKSGDTYTIEFNHSDKYNSNATYSGKYVGKLSGGTKAAAVKTARRSSAASVKADSRKANATTSVDRRMITATK